uniref:DHHA2 domain-containing protein n=1 Tax=Aureoumbra lagunensis TaxID=44058 RepID=A0A7S3NPR1_9STRA|mmetsp:Transcript_8431/g.12864  ORF Transcript_8431/g.12864 Transcript_8431/m.12864 type:complete len:468 (-) Transcript_8431:208-1611(-)
MHHHRRRFVVAMSLIFNSGRTMSWHHGLLERKARLLSGESLVIAVGNSAGDVDSIVSAMGMAYLLNGVAMAAIRADEFALRRDAVALLEFCGCVTFDQDRDGCAKELLYIDDTFQATAVALTDHNRLDQRLFKNSPKVHAVLDHHMDEGQHLEAKIRHVDPALGSTCSLVAQRILEEVVPDELPTSLLVAMLGTIALDTRGFDPKQNKFSQRDILVSHKILDALSCEQSEQGSDVKTLRKRTIPTLAAFRGASTIVELAQALGDARRDVGHLKASQLLRMDYKQAKIPDTHNNNFGDIGVAGVLVDLPTLIERLTPEQTLASILDDLGQEKPDLAIVFAMTSVDKSKKPKKKSILYRIVDPNLLPPGFSIEKFEAALTSLGEETNSLPPHLAENPLYHAQGIIEHGFRLQFSYHPHDITLRFSYLPKVVTRKTMLPALLHVLQASTFTTTAPASSSFSDYGEEGELR